MLKEKFKDIFETEAEYIFSAAGRVNLIGEHVDYCGGQVLPAALSLKCQVAVRKNGTNLMRIAATTIDARAEIDLTNTGAYCDLEWGMYQAGVADELKKAGLWIAGTALEGSSLHYDADLTGALAIVIGSEGEGLSRLVREKCDFLVKIPMLGQAESLNASVAAGVLMYEAVRQRNKSK